jgi:hypothetical protein
MNSPSTISSSSLACHPERSLADGAANRHAQSKDPHHPETTRDRGGKFRVVVRFFDENEGELLSASGRETEKCAGAARKCRIGAAEGTSPAGAAPWYENARMTQ